MPKSYRVRTEVGKDKAIKVQLEQDFESLEILSLKILQSDIYSRICADYGVVVGRITANNGLGLPNCKVSIFVPLTDEDELNPVISELYPYKTLDDVNDEGYRYNLLPYTKSHGGHTPTGTFPSRKDVLTNPTLIEIYDRYFKFTAKTNDSGDFMLFGVPLGSQTVHVDIDLSDIGEFSMSPQDLVRIGVATENQVSGLLFNSSSNLDSLPQLLSFNRVIEVYPLWGQPEVCELGITRTDFDLVKEAGITIQPAAIFMGSLISNEDKRAVKKKCKVNRKLGNLCTLTSGPGEILAIRQTIAIDSLGYPVLEVYQLDEGGKVIDDNGTWLIDVPMNLDFVYTNEFGERTFSNDPKIGVPTKAKYRFKIKWEQPATLSGPVKRATFLVPNIKEWGWSSTTDDPSYFNTTDYVNCIAPNPNDWNDINFKAVAASYAFSLDWKDYGQTNAGVLTTLGQRMVQEAVNCEDRFYEMKYNKVYTVSQLLTEYRASSGNKKFLAIRDILDDTCESTTNPFPFNDGQFQFDILYLLFKILSLIAIPILIAVIFIKHIVAKIVCLLADFLCSIKRFVCKFFPNSDFCDKMKGVCNEWEDKCENQVMNLPALTYPDCELCDCATPTTTPVDPGSFPGQSGLNTLNIQDGSFTQTVEYQNLRYTGSTLNFSGLTTVPQSESANVGPSGLIENDCKSFSFSLPFSEKINLFNTKAKYFDQYGSTNPGGGVNRIKVTFNIDNNPNEFHYDNIVALVLDSATDFPISGGSLFTFTKRFDNSDPNLTAFTSTINQYGTESITGTPVGSPISFVGPDGVVNVVYQSFVTLEYANPDITPGQPSSLSANYQIRTSGDDGKYAKFPMDQEYFQVIYSGTVADVIAESNSVSLAPNCFAHRYLNGGVRVITNRVDIPNNPDILQQYNNEILTPIECISGFSDFKVIFMVRGVDPNSTRTRCTYDLSRIFGYNFGEPGKTVTINKAKLNIPIQPGIRCVRHNLSSSDATDTVYSSQKLYHKSFAFKPDPTIFIPFTSTKPSFYSSLDALNLNGSNGIPDLTINQVINGGGGGDSTVTINNNNDYSRELWYNTNSTILTAPLLPLDSVVYYNPTLSGGALTGDENRYNTPLNGRNRGYFKNEIVEGGSVFGIEAGAAGQRYEVSVSVLGLINPNPLTAAPQFNSVPVNWFFSQRYPETAMSMVLGDDDRQIIMRSDRLPMSNTPKDGQTNTNNPIDYSLPLMSNTLLSFYPIPDDGLTTNVTAGTATLTIGEGNGQDNQDSLNTNPAVSNGGIASTYSCEGLVPLECYYVDPTSGFVYVRPSGDNCYTNGGWGNFNYVSGEKILVNGCYKLVTKPLKSLKVDLYLMFEWMLRMKISFAACRNVFGHIFTNQWINGTLYAFPFQNETRYTSPGIDPNNPNSLGPNQPYSCSCKHLIFLDPKTNTFYYRVAPYSESFGYIGRDNPRGILNTNLKGNQKDLMFPTTIMDLGPRNDYMDELSYSDEFQGYVVNRLAATSFQDTDELLNLFITSRMVSGSIRDTIKDAARLGLANDPVKRFFSRDNNKIDADYAQMGAINSQIGVIPYDSTVYEDPNDIFFNSAESDSNVFGVAFSANTQIRDWLSPKRTIVSPGSDPNFTCTFDEFPVFSQDIPMYLWNIKQNSEGAAEDSIFGDQKNEWYTIPISGEFNHIRYQSIDRIDDSMPIGSRTMIPNDPSSESNFKGYIYNVVGGQVDFSYPNYTPPPSGPIDRKINNTAPFYFYFGLTKGASAFDRFLVKWVQTDTIVF
jgi:hypothetical protein